MTHRQIAEAMLQELEMAELRATENPGDYKAACEAMRQEIKFAVACGVEAVDVLHALVEIAPDFDSRRVAFDNMRDSCEKTGYSKAACEVVREDITRAIARGVSAFDVVDALIGEFDRTFDRHDVAFD